MQTPFYIKQSNLESYFGKRNNGQPSSFSKIPLSTKQTCEQRSDSSLMWNLKRLKWLWDFNTIFTLSDTILIFLILFFLIASYSLKFQYQYWIKSHREYLMDTRKTDWIIPRTQRQVQTGWSEQVDYQKETRNCSSLWTRCTVAFDILEGSNAYNHRMSPR